MCVCVCVCLYVCVCLFAYFVCKCADDDVCQRKSISNLLLWDRISPLNIEIPAFFFSAWLPCSRPQCSFFCFPFLSLLCWRKTELGFIAFSPELCHYLPIHSFILIKLLDITDFAIQMLGSISISETYNPLWQRNCSAWCLPKRNISSSFSSNYKSLF